MNKLLLSLCLFVVTCNATENKKPAIVSCYSSMSSKKQRHEITMSDGTRLVIQSSIGEPQDVRVSVSQKRLPIKQGDK